MGIAMATPQVSRKSNSNSREQSNNEGDGYFSETQLKSQCEMLQTLSRLLVKFVKFWQIFLELPWDCVKVQEKEKGKSLTCVHVLQKSVKLDNFVM